MSEAVSIVIPTWNGLELLKRFLPSVIKAATRYIERSHSAVEIVIVDDGSEDQTVDWLRVQGFRADDPRSRDDRMPTGAAALCEPSADEPLTVSFKLVRNERNLGFGETCNRGFQAAAHPLVLLLNNDVEIEADAIVPLVENFSDDSVFAAHCRVFDLENGSECGTGKVGRFARGFIRVHRSYAARGSGAEASKRAGLVSMFAGGGSAMFDREKFLTIGGFEPLLSPFYWEDVELSYRAWKRGYVVLYEPRSVTHHAISSTIRKLDTRAVRKIEQRNRLVYHWIHLHDLGMIASHAIWVIVLAATSPVRKKAGFASACVAALKLLPSIQKRRREEREASRRSDREIFRIFGELEDRNDVVAYDDLAELEPPRTGNHL